MNGFRVLAIAAWVVFLIDAAGIVRGAWRKVRVPDHVSEVLKAARTL